MIDFDLATRTVTDRLALPGRTFGLAWRANPFGRRDDSSMAFGWDANGDGIAHQINLTDGTWEGDLGLAPTGLARNNSNPCP